MNRLIGLTFCVAVLLAATFAFSPRAVPVFPATGLRVDTVLLLDAARAGTRLVAVGERGRIFLSDDEGATWNATPSPTEATLTAVWFADARHGWVVGHDAVILRTDDAGANWHVAHAAPAEERPLLDVRFIGPERGFAVGAYGAYLETSDGGRTWTARGIADDDRHLNGIAAGAGGELLIAGESGALLLSTDGGRRWERLESPYQGSFFGALAPERDHFLVFGLRGNVYRSGDLGRNWHRAGQPAEVSLMGGRVFAPS
ncbi:MAG: sialidase, partial [Burkholderiales bacterium]|nr:sialidase [Burkholderiales bacterium]